MSSGSSLIQSVSKGVVENTAREVKASTSNNKLGKDAFLQLLCTQLQYQDPLNPQSDTEFVAQLAQYSQLEELQNLSSTNENTQALGLVGKNVIIQTTSSSSSTGKITLSGTVDYVTYVNGEAKLSVNDKLYSLEDLYSVIDETYLIKQGLPTVEKEIKETFDKSKPEDITFDVNLGKGDTVASQVGIIMNGTLIDSKYVTLNGSTVTISKDVFKDLNEGTYKPSIIFNDYFTTVVTDKITITVKDKVTVDDNANSSGNTTPTDGSKATEGSKASENNKADEGNKTAMADQSSTDGVSEAAMAALLQDRA